jgi:hypothetical protein
LRDRDISEIGHIVAEGCETPAQSSHANRGRTHIDATASGAQIEWHANDGE